MEKLKNKANCLIWIKTDKVIVELIVTDKSS